ncbi:MAG: hypothetical protein FWD68_02355 [Alphaproteobacteria bacterium]|nr:hypothetical protein [Alphaproteobacteria bacterium]
MGEIETDTSAAVPALSHAAVLAALQRLTVRQKATVMACAKTLAQKYRNPSLAEDLIQEAYTRALSGDRSWRCDLTVENFLMGCMRSIVSGWHKKARRERPIKDDEDFPDNRNPSESQEAGQDIARILALFDDDPVAVTIVKAMAEGREGAEIQAICGLSGQKYDSRRRKIRRRINTFLGQKEEEGEA